MAIRVPGSKSCDEKAERVHDSSRRLRRLFMLSKKVVSISRKGGASPQLLYGTTIFIGEQNVSLSCGDFRALTFQDLTNKSYVIALVNGDIHQEDTLYTRVHSSCITSETLQSLDCDCVSQLNGALDRIADADAGVLFYLFQEGRGAGYVGKSRAIMHTQHAADKITTFEAYNMLGMKDDYRSYRIIGEICHMMGIDEKQFVLLTNNPDKIRGFQEAGLHMGRQEAIEVLPNPFNRAYLVSKEAYGHKLSLARASGTSQEDVCDELDMPSVKPFEPYFVGRNNRFIHTSSYFLPIRNMLSDPEIDELSEIQPHWFKVKVFYDLAAQQELVTLKYGNVRSGKERPAIRIHSESIMNRFPLTELPYRDLYCASIREIVKRNAGVLLLFHNDGYGRGFGNFVLGKKLNESDSSQLPDDLRDFSAASQILRLLLGKENKPVDVLYNNLDSLPKYFEHFATEGINVRELINLNAEKMPIVSSLLEPARPHQPLRLSIVSSPSHSHSEYHSNGCGCLSDPGDVSDENTVPNLPLQLVSTDPQAASSVLSLPLVLGSPVSSSQGSSTSELSVCYRTPLSPVNRRLSSGSNC